MTYTIIVAVGKHTLSPEEGPTAIEELGARASSGFPKPAKRAKAGGKLFFSVAKLLTSDNGLRFRKRSPST